ncbi:MAG: hypothetical protein WDA11_12170 [Thiohalomonadaceae bacterium]
MNCPDIRNLRLSDASLKAIERIKRKPGLAKALQGSMAGGQIVNIFVSPTPPAATLYSIHSADWVTFATALSGIPAIARASMQTEAYNEWIESQLRNNFAESQFWKAVYDGCLFR